MIAFCVNLCLVDFFSLFFPMLFFSSAMPLLQNVKIRYFNDLFTDRELELRELRKVVLSSQEENISLNKEMEELKVHLPECVIYNYLTHQNRYKNLLPLSVFQSLLQKVEDDLGAVKAYGASLTAQRNSLRMVPNLFGVINF